MLRFEVGELGKAPLPALDLALPVTIVGSGASAQVRLPAQVARDVHVRIEGGRWVAIGDVIVDGVRKPAGEGGPLGAAVVFELGTYRVRVAPSPTGSLGSSPARTESLARELVRGLLGSDAAPALEVEATGSRRSLPPPEARIVVGRGDDADWVILDEELSRAHAEVRRAWDGTTIRDLGSKNGTRVDGEAIGEREVDLHDGAKIELGDVVLRFRDPAERHLNGDASVAPTAPAPTITTEPAAAVTRVNVERPHTQVPFYVALVVAAVAIIAAMWIVAS
jgi:predicted component of type VI protein secretion system